MSRLGIGGGGPVGATEVLLIELEMSCVMFAVKAPIELKKLEKEETKFFPVSDSANFFWMKGGKTLIR